MKSISALALAFGFVSPVLAAVAGHDIVKLGQGEVSEVELARTVQSNASDLDVKEFTNILITDHSKAFDELKPIASARNVTLDSSMDDEHKKFASTLSKKPIGTSYDRTYVKQMVKDHKKDIKDLEKARSEATDPAMQQWLDNSLAVVRTHLKIAETLDRKFR
jgi:putative membrane protein